MTTNKKGWYYYVITGLCFASIPFTAFSVYSIFELWKAGEMLSNYTSTLQSMFIICIQFWLVREMLWYEAGYTIVTTTEYKLFKCSERGKEESFMMFADSAEELEFFFEQTQPNKKFEIEESELRGRSIAMKVFNQNDQTSEMISDENSDIHSKS
jgi:hypothetical protein